MPSLFFVREINSEWEVAAEVNRLRIYLNKKYTYVYLASRKNSDERSLIGKFRIL